MAINKRVAAAMKKVAKPKRKKTWADSQSAPQSKVYKAANDKAVLAKPVGFRWTDLGASRLGKNASVKPSAADIEKYKGKTFSKGGEQHSYLYSEKRADKTDVKKSEKFKAGGRPKKTWADSQNAPQSTVYKAANDKEVVAKPVGFRWTGYGANKLGVNVMSKPSAADIEQYKNKTFKLRGESVRYLYSEKRADKSDVKRKDKFEDGGIYAHGGETSIEKDFYLQENFRGENYTVHYNALITPTGDWTDTYNCWIDRKSKMFGGSSHSVLKIMSELDAKSFIENVNETNIKDWYNEFSKKPSKDGGMMEDGGMYADGGRLRWNDVSIHINKNTEEDMRNAGFSFDQKGNAPIYYNGKEVGFLSNFNGVMLNDDYVDQLVPMFNNFRGAGVWNYRGWKEDAAAKKRQYGSKMEDGGMMAKGGMFGGRQYDPYNEPADKARHAKPIGWRFTDAKAKRLKESPYEKPTAEQIEKYRGKGVYFENRQDKSDRTYSRKLADGGYMADGGLADNEVLRVKFVAVDVHEDSYEGGEGRSVTSYSMPEYKGYQIDPMNPLRFFYYNLGLSMDANDYVIIDDCVHFDQLQDEDGSEASEYDKEQWREGKKVLYNAHYTICLDAIAERSLTDGELSAILGIGVYRSGGAVQSGVQSENYSEDRDKLVVAKPVGWRFTNKFAKRKGFDAYRKPTAEEIEKYKGSGKIYYEVRFDKSDKNVRRRFEDGGMMADGGMMEDDSYARGGSPKISNSESRSYTENMLPFRANNLEGKTLDNGDYVVLSYGYYPIWFYSSATHKWYGNKDKYSQSTAKQISQSRPSYDATILPKRELDEVMFSSSLGKLHDEERIVEEANV